jgi:hypothetical protein
VSLRDFFLRPPKGGNEKGVKRVSEMRNPPARQSLRVSFEAGYDQATVRRGGGAKEVGVPDLRNFARGAQPAQEPGEPQNFYDVEAAHDGGDPHGRVVPGETDVAPAGLKAVPVQNPDTRQSARGDGRST